MSIDINNQTRNRIDLKLIELVANKFLQKYNINKDISIAFVGDVTMRRLNGQYRGKDRATDILSFASDEKGELGEIVIDYAQIKRQSRLYSKSVKDELIFILVHGLYHLLGYNDDTEQKRLAMIRMGEEFIKKMHD